MTVVCGTYNRLLAISALALCLLISGCGGGTDKAPDPPRERARLLLDMLKALTEKDYQAASTKAQKLKDAAPIDVAISNLEALELDNLTIWQAGKALEKGEVDKANEVLTAAIRKRGLVGRLVEAQEELKSLREVAKLAEKTRAPEDATDLARTAGMIKKTAALHVALAEFVPFADGVLVRAREMLAKENMRALADLCADLDLLWALGAPESQTLVALVAAEDAAHPESKLYRALLSKDWPEECLLLPDSGAARSIAVFRSAAAGRGKDRQAVYARIKAVSPSDYRSLLAQSTFLALNDPRMNCEEGISKIVAAAELWEKENRPGKWLASPLSATKGKLSRLNPLVLYPFYVYIPSFASNAQKQP